MGQSGLGLHTPEGKGQQKLVMCYFTRVSDESFDFFFDYNVTNENN